MARKTEPDGVEPYDTLNCTHTALRRAARQLTQLYDKALSPSGLTSAQAMLVGQLEQLGGTVGGEAPSLQTLAIRLAIQISALSHAMRPLVRDGLVEIVTDEEDRRVKRARLTAKGLAQTHMMYGLWNETNRRMDQVLGNGATEHLRLLAGQVASPEFLAAFQRNEAEVDPAGPIPLEDVRALAGEDIDE